MWARCMDVKLLVVSEGAADGGVKLGREVTEGWDEKQTLCRAQARESRRGDE